MHRDATSWLTSNVTAALVSWHWGSELAPGNGLWPRTQVTGASSEAGIVQRYLLSRHLHHCLLPNFGTQQLTSQRLHRRQDWRHRLLSVA